MLILTTEQMREVDITACARVGESTLMAIAGRRIATLIERYARSKHVVAFAGPGNNGGDAYAALAELDSSFDRRIFAAGAATASSARRDAERRAAQAGVKVLKFPETLTDARLAIGDAGIVVDALFGTGARLPMRDPYATVVRAINGSDRAVICVDIPSGIDAENGTLHDPAIRGTVTLTLGALKPGLLLDPAREAVGDLWLAEIGIDAHLESAPAFAALNDAEFLALLPHRAANADKRSAGAPLIVAGSRQFPGAAVLCARAAARAGAGYVTVATVETASAILRSHLVEQVVTEISQTCSPEQAVESLLDTARHASAVAIGPGLGLDERTGEIVRGFLRQTSLPFVADASALFHFAKHREVLANPQCIITPHAGEFARLSGGGSVHDDQRVKRLRAFSEQTGCTTLLKGRTTLIDDGTTIHMNTTGTAALATAGTGDVLTGIIATLLSAGMSPVDAGRTGSYWHGLAGRYAATHRQVGVTAGDLPDVLAACLPAPTPTRDDLQQIF